MTGGILRDLANAANLRKESKKIFISAAQRLAKRIVDTGRVGDRVRVGSRTYALENAAWTLIDVNGKTFESTPPIKTLVVNTGSWEMDTDSRVYDDRRVVTLLELTAPGEAPLDSGPHYADLESLLAAEREGAYDFEGFGPTSFERASIFDYEAFANDSEDILKEFIKLFQEESERRKTTADKLFALAG